MVEVFRAEIADASEIKRCLKISGTKLRQWNRWYFRHRLDRYLNPKPKPMKTTSQSEYVRELERRLIAAEKEAKQLRLRIEAYETAIDIAENEFKIPILKKFATKRSKN